MLNSEILWIVQNFKNAMPIQYFNFRCNSDYKSRLSCDCRLTIIAIWWQLKVLCAAIKAVLWAITIKTIKIMVLALFCWVLLWFKWFFRSALIFKTDGIKFILIFMSCHLSQCQIRFLKCKNDIFWNLHNSNILL